MTYRFLAHTADVRVAIDAANLEEVFSDAAAIVRRLCVGESLVRARQERQVALEGEATDELLLQFMRELLYWYETLGFLPAALEVERLEPTALRGRISGEVFDRRRHRAEPEVKAVTRHGLVVRRIDGGWQAEVLFDV